MRSPAFRFYADDFMAGTLDLSQAEVGAYIRLLCHQWNRGSIPVEPDKLARLAGGSVSVDVLDKFPEGSDGLRRNCRLEEERQKQDHFRELQREKGISSGKSRRTAVEPRLNHGSNSVGIPVEPGLNLPFPSPLPVLTQQDIAHAAPWVVEFSLELPASLQTENCLQAVKTWLQYKKEKRQAYKPTGLKASLTKWGNEFTSATFPSAVEASIACGWSGIFLPKAPLQQSSGKKLADIDWRDAI